MSFLNKVVIVTGGSSGLGADAALAFAKEGADVTIVGRDQTRLDKVAAEISKIGNSPLVVQADFSKDEDLKAVISKTVEKFGKIDVLVNSAGIVVSATILDENLPEVFDRTIATNLRSIVLLTNYAAPHLVKTKGNIVNISSIAGTKPMSLFGVGFGALCASKAGLEHFSRVAALELAEKGVRVNTLSPGPVESPLLESMGGKDLSPIAAQTALKFLTQPDEISGMILYLASEKARSITGSNILIGSGMSLKM